MTKISHKELENYIKEILDCNAFELYSDESKKFYIPYMMNDALECYLLLKNCRMTGKYLPELNETITAEFITQSSDSTSPDSSAIIFRQGTENVFIIWFEEAYRVLKCYRYDQIGHFWVKGEEHWRRLVYIIGTIYDKYEYMGKQVCNEKEIDLLPLMEFAPFRMYSPIHESLDTYYSESRSGLECMSSLAKEADDKEFLRLLNIYRLFSSDRPAIKIHFPIRLIRKKIFRALNHPNRQNLYELIFQKVHDASIVYPERSYHPALNEEINSARKKSTEQLHEKGFSGDYPLFHKENLQVLAMEEHPFTILEAKDFSFRIQFMVSETADKNPIPQRSKTINHSETANTSETSSSLNAGFFKKRGNRSWIASDLSLINKFQV